ncbi:aminotransferase class V-fold PLP-dependent enzyme [Rudanella paleaurantiibacter]|uniref:cysteine desulfurase n=1 Tax=Rudanella paleaurantiibacter TaxID=2614655 RepID=A0A7J5TSA1_9BACT|nr:cysteine desulfurase family protein [Rudanella paleaurantiibacter]KAB7725977.1 aminotransferase class V-fold PLP-dependent enzyme [Rudanella paleaurantiibacter]
MIYLDNNATTRIDPRVLDAMMPFLTDNFANAASTHPFGVSAHEAVKTARQQLADLLGCETHELVFTSGATEAINLAIKGVAENYQHKGKHIVTVQTEHKAVLDVCQYLEKRGYDVTYLPVQPDRSVGAGLLDLNDLKAALRPDTILVSVMWVNNETGVIQSIREIAQLAHEAGALFMTDATQAVGKLPIDVDNIHIDLLTFSAHKFYGPKGIGGLFVRQRRPNKVKLEALVHGGGHERGLRSGTLNVPGIVGMGKAAELAPVADLTEMKRVGLLRDQLETELLQIPGTRVNGNRDHRLYNTTNIYFENCDSDALIMGLEGIAVSNGSACTAASIDPSHVLLAMGLTETEAFSCLRFSLGRFTTEADIENTVKAVKEVVESLRALV